MATSGVLGETVRSSIHHVDGNNPILGATFTVLVADRPDGSTFPVTINEIAHGIYEAVVESHVSDVDGEWFLLLEADNGYRYEEVFDFVDERPTVIPVPQAPQRGATRRQIRLMLAQMMGDLTLAVATRDGTENIIHDHINFNREHNAFNGMQIYCADAQATQNISKLSTIVSNNSSTQTVNIIPAFPQPTKKGDTFELYNYRDIGWRFDEYNRAINSAIQRGGEEHGTDPYVVITDERYSKETNSVSIPLEFAYFSGVDVIDERGHYKKVPYQYYEVDTFSSEVRLSGPYVYKADRKKLRLRGHREPSLLFTDDAKTMLPTEWVVAEAASILYQHDVSMGSGGRERLIQFARAGADGRRSTILTTYGPNTVKMRRG